MKILFFRSPDGTLNFGDELNIWILDNFLDAKLFDKAKGDLMMVGTVLNEKNVNEDRPLIVFGSGAGYYQKADLDGVDVRFVRGPRTAAVYPGTKAITDPGILVAAKHKEKPQGDLVSFIPHWETAREYPELAEQLLEIGVTVIDPRQNPEPVIAAVKRSRLVLAEAMHGAIVADALRIPWIPVMSRQGHTFKWFDWCESMGLSYNPADLQVMSLSAAMKWPQQLSPEFHWSNRLSGVQYEMDKFRMELEHGVL